MVVEWKPVCRLPDDVSAASIRRVNVAQYSPTRIDPVLFIFRVRPTGNVNRIFLRAFRLCLGHMLRHRGTDRKRNSAKWTRPSDPAETTVGERARSGTNQPGSPRNDRATPSVLISGPERSKQFKFGVDRRRQTTVYGRCWYVGRLHPSPPPTRPILPPSGIFGAG